MAARRRPRASRAARPAGLRLQSCFASLVRKGCRRFSRRRPVLPVMAQRFGGRDWYLAVIGQLAADDDLEQVRAALPPGIPLLAVDPFLGAFEDDVVAEILLGQQRQGLILAGEPVYLTAGEA